MSVYEYDKWIHEKINPSRYIMNPTPIKIKKASSKKSNRYKSKGRIGKPLPFNSTILLYIKNRVNKC